MTPDGDKPQKWPPRVWTARIWLEIGGIALALIAVIALATRFLQLGVDWYLVIRPGCLAMLRGESPFDAVPYFGFPPWALLPFMPLALLPERLGRAISLLLDW